MRSKENAETPPVFMALMAKLIAFLVALPVFVLCLFLVTSDTGDLGDPLREISLGLSQQTVIDRAAEARGYKNMAPYAESLSLPDDAAAIGIHVGDYGDMSTYIVCPDENAVPSYVGISHKDDLVGPVNAKQSLVDAMVDYCAVVPADTFATITAPQ